MQIALKATHNPIAHKLQIIFPAVFSYFYLYFEPDELTMPPTAQEQYYHSVAQHTHRGIL